MKSTKPMPAAMQHDNEDNSVETGQLLSAHTENSPSCHESTNQTTVATTTLNPYKDVTSIESRMYEMLLLFRLAIPIFIVQLGSVTPGFLVASYIGRTYPSEVYLDGYTIASVTTNLCILSLLQGLYSAADTLSPQAYGAGSRNQVGYIAVRGYIASMIVILPIVLFLLLYMKQMLLWFGQDSVSVSLAYEWFRIYAMALPFYSLYQVTIKFLSAQSQMQPLLHCCILSTCIILPSLLFVFGSMFGFIGTAMALVLYHVFNSMSLIVYLYYYQPHDPLTWPGLHECIQHAIEWKPFISYMTLGAGGILATSEWTYWETIALIIGTFGTVPLSVHTIPAQVLMMSFMGPFSVGIALSIRLGSTLSVSVSRAQQTTIDTFVFSMISFGLLSIIMFVQQDSLIYLFTTSDAVIDGCHEIWWKVCVFSFFLSIFGIHMGTCFGLGMQWTLGVSTFVCLWIIGLPSGYYVSVVRNGGINLLWSAIWPPYALLAIMLAIAIVSADWNQIAIDIRLREGAEQRNECRNSTSTNIGTEDMTSLMLPQHIDDKTYGSMR